MAYLEFYVEYTKATGKKPIYHGKETSVFQAWLLNATLKREKFVAEFYEFEDLEEDLLDALEIMRADDETLYTFDQDISMKFVEYEFEVFYAEFAFETKTSRYFKLFEGKEYDDDYLLYINKNGNDASCINYEDVPEIEFPGYPKEFILWKNLIDENPFSDEDLEEPEFIAIHISHDNDMYKDNMFLILEEKFEGHHKSLDRYMGIACYYENSELKPMLFIRDVSFHENSASYDAYEVEELDEFMTYFELE